MPRLPRVHLPNGFYHATLRGNHQQDIFRTDSDRRLLNAIVARSIATYGARVHAYCWMSNHIHLLIQVSEEPLGAIIRQIASEYARAFQRAIETTGHLFERRYHAKLVLNDRYLLTVLKYIHRNPVDAGISDSAANYPWSSHGAYAGTRTETWLTTDFVLAMFAAARPAAIAAYLRFIDEPADDPDAQDATPSKSRSLEALIAQACQLFGITLAELQGEGRDVRLMQVRAWISRQAINSGIANLTQLSRALGRDRATLRNAMARYSQSQAASAIPTLYTGT